MPRKIPPSLFTSRFEFDKNNTQFLESFGVGLDEEIKNGLPLDRENHVRGKLISEEDLAEQDSDRTPGTEISVATHPLFERPLDASLKRELTDGTKASVAIYGDRKSIRLYGGPKGDKTRPNEIILATDETGKVVSETHKYEVMENGVITQSYFLDYDPESGKLNNAVYMNESPEPHEPKMIHAAFLKGKPVEIKETYTDDQGNVKKFDDRTPEQVKRWDVEKRKMGKPLYCYNRAERMKHAAVDVSKATIINGTAYTIAKTLSQKDKIEKGLIKKMAKPTRTPTAHDLMDQESGMIEITLNAANKSMQKFNVSAMRKIHEVNWKGPKRSKKRPVQLPSGKQDTPEKRQVAEVANAQAKGLLNTPEAVKVDQEAAVQKMPTSFDGEAVEIKHDLQADIERSIVANNQIKKDAKRKAGTNQR